MNDVIYVSFNDKNEAFYHILLLIPILNDSF